MERNLVVERGNYTPVSERAVEIVERKGIGHPDSLIDGIMEEISKELSKAYLAEFGRVLHHNVDKGLICGGGTKAEFGGGVFTKPIYVILSGRATDQANGKTFPIHHIALESAHKYFKKAVPELNVQDDVQLDSRIAPGSPDLVDLFLRGPKVPFANDTSFGTGFAPFTELERIVFESEQLLNSHPYKKAHPEVGPDIKVMGLREGSKLKLTVAVAFVSKHLSDIKAYAEAKARVREDVMALSKKFTDKHVDVFVNTADDMENGSVYITLTGTSAEMGDDGSVGRGNRVNGLITPMRSMTMEAASGKNPVNHVGKIYSVLASEAAASIAKEHSDIKDITITLLSQIGKPIDQPKVASATIIAEESEFARLQKAVHSDLDARLSGITEVTERIVAGKTPLF